MVAAETITNAEARRARTARAPSVGAKGNIAVEAKNRTHSGDVQLVRSVLNLVPGLAFEVKIPNFILMEPVIHNARYIRLNKYI